MYDIYTRLGISSDADAREIRSAYARELKMIDQESEAAAFQSLREAYELALRFASRDALPAAFPTPAPESEAEQAPEDAQTPPMQADVPQAEQIEHLARATWAHCLDLIQQTADVDYHAWDEVLRRTLADDLLINIQSRLWFEALVIQHLADGWRPGHDWLLIAASVIFGWEEDSRRLARFRSGAFISRSLTELRLMEGMPEKERAVLRAAIARMRDPRPPDTNDLVQYSAALARLNKLFPNLMAVSIDAEVFRHWRQARITEPVLADQVESSRPSLSQVLVWLLAIAVVVSIFTTKFSTWGDSPPDVALSQLQLQEIGSRIAYRAKPSQKNTLTVEYEVFLDENRAFLGMNLRRSSRDDSFDAAVAKAIRETPPFPPNTVTVYRAKYSIPPPASKP